MDIIRKFIPILIWADNIALIIGSIFATDLSKYKIYVFIVVAIDIFTSIYWIIYNRIVDKNMEKLNKAVDIKIYSNKIEIIGNKKDTTKFLNGINNFLRRCYEKKQVPRKKVLSSNIIKKYGSYQKTLSRYSRITREQQSKSNKNR